MSDQIIKLETLKLAKEAGFDWAIYPADYTQTIVQKWLREKYNIPHLSLLVQNS